jgi:hypothetical protein
LRQRPPSVISDEGEGAERESNVDARLQPHKPAWIVVEVVVPLVLLGLDDQVVVAAPGEDVPDATLGVADSCRGVVFGKSEGWGDAGAG